MGCATSLIKIIVFIFNLVLALCGLGLLIAGILLIKDVADYTDFLDGKYKAPPILLIVVGSTIFIVSFCGFCGALRESHCMLCTYVVLVLAIFITQVVVASLAFAYRDDTEDIMAEKLRSYIKNYASHKEVVDSMQTNLKCCGADSALDYPYNILPVSCCEDNVECLKEHNLYYQQGCLKALESYINRQGNIIGIIAIVIACVEITGIVFGLCLANSIRNAERRATV